MLTVAPLVATQRMQDVLELCYELFSHVLEWNDMRNQACIPRKYVDESVSGLKLKMNHSEQNQMCFTINNKVEHFHWNLIKQIHKQMIQTFQQY